MKTGVIDVGGGLRGIYPSGIFDYCIDKGIHFDVCIGISAGSANIASYMAGQKGRNVPFYVEYPFRKEYMSIRNFLKKGVFLDVKYIYGTLSNSDGERPLDYKAMAANPAEYIAIASNAITGEIKHFSIDDFAQDDYRVNMASSAIPFVCKPIEYDGQYYYDGALADPIPLDLAFSKGCDKVVLILTKPRDTVRTPEKDAKLAKLIKRKYPAAAQNLCCRAQRYNEGVEKAKQLEKEGRVLIIAPDDISGIGTLTKDEKVLRSLYEKGMKDAEAIEAFLK